MARPKPNPPVHSVSINLPDDLWRRLAVYWHGRMLPTRTAAMIELLDFALTEKLRLPEKETTR